MNRYHILLFHLLRDGDGGDDVRDVHVHRDRRGRDVHDRGHGLHYFHDGVRVHHDGWSFIRTEIIVLTCCF